LQAGRGREPLAAIPDLAEHPGGEPHLQPGQAQQDLAVRVASVTLQELAQARLPLGALPVQQEQLASR
jgi:hypothetical protein